MSPPPGVNAQLRQLVHYHLDNGFLENALFFAHRLYALESRSADSTYLVALCNLRLGRHKAAFDYARIKGACTHNLACAYILAQACLALERYDHGAFALEKVRGLWTGRSHWNKHSDTSRRHAPDAAACFCLLGKLYAGHGDTKKAIDCYVEALKINSFMWDAFTGLCDIGAVVRPQNIFQITPDMLTSISYSSIHVASNQPGSAQDSPHTKNPFVVPPDNDPFNTSTRQGGDGGLSTGGSNLFSRLNGSNPTIIPTYQEDESLINGQSLPQDDDIMMGEAGGPVLNNRSADSSTALGPKPKLPNYNLMEPSRMQHMASRARTKTNSESDQTEIPRPTFQNSHKRTVSGHSAQQINSSNLQPLDPTAAPPRRSVRLLNSISQIRPTSSRLMNATSKELDPKGRDVRKVKASGTKGRMGTATTVGRVVSGNRKPQIEIAEPSKEETRPMSMVTTAMLPPKASSQIEAAREHDVLNWLLDLLLKIGSGYKYLSRYDANRALESFSAVPKAQRETPWILAQIGRAYYERAMYADAHKSFQRIRDMAPSYVEHMEVYSNTLWQLKREIDLGYLAHTLMSQDRLSPQAWCALGNASSLERQHDDAVKCFARATQLDPKFAYAFTLQGHEHVANEEYDKAMIAYRKAVSADNRHYNGWYGLGNVYERLGKYEVAERHYRAAAHINPNNAMIVVRIGLVLDRLKNHNAALMQFEAAIRIDSRSIMARFRKAQILLKLNSPAESLQELFWLKDAAPDDPNIHFLLGRCYKRLRDRPRAIRHLTIAMNLDPKSHGVIKEIMESIDVDDEIGNSSEEDY